MRSHHGVIRVLRWCVTLATVIVGTASGFSMFYWFGFTRTVPYPGGKYAPNWTEAGMMDGGFVCFRGQGMTDVGADSPYNVIGTHWHWSRNHDASARLLWLKPVLNWISGDFVIPGWLLVGPPLGVAAALWAPVVFARRRRLGECECGYDLRGVGSGICPECGKGAEGSRDATRGE